MNDEDINFFACEEHCNFLNVLDFNNNIKMYSCYDFGVINLNIRSLEKHFTELQTFLHACDYKFRLIVITETWLDSTYDIRCLISKDILFIP